MMVIGWPENMLYKMPHTAPDTRLSMADFKIKKYFKQFCYLFDFNLLKSYHVVIGSHTK